MSRIEQERIAADLEIMWRAYVDADGSFVGAARLLGCHRNTIGRVLQENGISGWVWRQRLLAHKMRIRGDTNRIPLSRGMFAIVDEADWEHLMQWKWSASESPTAKTFYAVRGVGPRHNRSYVKMHQQLMGAGESGETPDHRDGDGLNNRRNNLRWATKADDQSANSTRLDNTTGFRGVTHHGQAKYIAKCGTRHLGVFDTAEEAAAAYDREAYRRYGQFAKLNFPRSKPTGRVAC